MNNSLEGDRMRKTQKNYGTLIILLAVSFMLITSLTAYAGVTDSGLVKFFRAYGINIEECERVDRYYCVNSDDGYVYVKSAPWWEFANYRQMLLNNERWMVYYTYNHEVETWGFVNGHTFRENFNIYVISGWVPMNKLIPVYNFNSFIEEFEGEFYPYTGGYEKLKTDEKVILWAWPGSGIVRTSAYKAKEIEDIGISHAYKDKDGREWGFIAGICIQQSNPIVSDIYTGVWLCISDPSNREIPAFYPALPWMHVAEKEPPKPNFDKPIFRSGDKIIVADMTEKNKFDWVSFSLSSQFRKLGTKVIPRGELILAPFSLSIAEPHNIDIIQGLWQRLYDELSDAANPERFKIPYAFAFALTPEEHVLCEAKPDEILNIIKDKELILTWPTPEIQWGDKLRVRYLRDYIKLLKENGHSNWAKIIEIVEGSNYLDDEY